jgi:hypothetical protein
VRRQHGMRRFVSSSAVSTALTAAQLSSIWRGAQMCRLARGSPASRAPRASSVRACTGLTGLSIRMQAGRRVLPPSTRCRPRDPRKLTHKPPAPSPFARTQVDRRDLRPLILVDERAPIELVRNIEQMFGEVVRRHAARAGMSHFNAERGGGPRLSLACTRNQGRCVRLPGGLGGRGLNGLAADT